MTSVFIFLISFVVFSFGRDDRCFPPSFASITIDSTCAQGVNTENPSFSCHGASFVQTSGIYTPCDDHSQCSQHVQPNEWCSIHREHFRWTGSGGCHCDRKLRTCLIERQRGPELQWAYCTPSNHFRCDARGYCSP